MSWYEKISFYYKQGLWDSEKVLAVVNKVLTQEEADEIIGEKEDVAES